MRKINSIFSECEVWENTPISEIFGRNSLGINQKIKRVIVYGATQMGKTTMIMNLINIKEERKAELSSALRGNAAQGNSATSTPIIYNRWDKDSFGIATGDEMNEREGTLNEYVSIEQFTSAISSINQYQRTTAQAESNADSVRYYYLPNNFFAEKESVQDIQIIDLPGFGEKNANMYGKAEAIIQHLRDFVAGAVVVIKADKIVNLENEYKHFLEKTHRNHLAIAITHALSVDSELKKNIAEKRGDFEKCNTAEDYAKAILKYFYEKLTNKQNGYLSKERYPLEIFFPIEKSAEIRKLFPALLELADAFDIILKQLIRRMDLMRNTTSINACIEKLQETEEIIDYNLLEKKESIVKLEKEKSKIEKDKNERNGEISKKNTTVKTLQKQIKGVEKKADKITKKISTLSEKEFKNAYKCFYRKHIRYYLDEEVLLLEVNDFFMSELKEEDKSLIKGFEKKIREVMSNVDFSEAQKKRLIANRAESAIDSLVSDIRSKLCGYRFLRSFHEGELITLLNQNKSSEVKKVQEELEKIKKALALLENAMLITLKRDAEVKSKIAFCNDSIKKLNIEKKAVAESKETVIDVFVDHFFKKEEELLSRMEKESDPEVATALFLTYSAIYLNIKPYLEEENNE